MALFLLEEPYRSILIDRYFDNLTTKEIATRLDVSVSAVHERHRRGLQKLRARLDREFGDRSNWCAALLPLFGQVPTGAATAAGSTAPASLRPGALVMRTKSKIAAVIIIAVGLAYAFWPRNEMASPPVCKRDKTPEAISGMAPVRDSRLPRDDKGSRTTPNAPAPTGIKGGGAGDEKVHGAGVPRERSRPYLGGRARGWRDHRVLRESR